MKYAHLNFKTCHLMYICVEYTVLVIVVILLSFTNVIELTIVVSLMSNLIKYI